jgi:hypothetical protein
LELQVYLFPQLGRTADRWAHDVVRGVSVSGSLNRIGILQVFPWAREGVQRRVYAVHGSVCDVSLRMWSDIPKRGGSLWVPSRHPCPYLGSLLSPTSLLSAAHSLHRVCPSHDNHSSCPLVSVATVFSQCRLCTASTLWLSGLLLVCPR